jgi:UDP-glucose 4-epimerase
LELKNLNVLVTGGAGFIGSNLTKKLLSRGAHVIVLDNFSIGKKTNLLGFPCEIFTGDVTEVDKLLHSKNIDVIFHLGAPSSDVLFRANPVEATKSTILCMTKICEFAAKKQVQKLVYATSASVYGRTLPPQSEASSTNPTNLYGLSKLLCEDIVIKFSKVKNVGLRTFAGYGPGEEHKGEIASVIAIFLYGLLKKQRPVIFGDGLQKRDFVYIDDVTEAFIRAAEREIEGVINVGSGESSSFIDILDTISDEVGVHIKPECKPKPIGYFDCTNADITLMRKCLGIKPIGIREGIKRFANYAINNSVNQK